MKQSQNPLEILSAIRQSEVSDAVYEKILTVIDSRTKNEPTVRQVWTYGIAAGLSFALSVGTVLYQYQTENKIDSFAEAINILPNNSLYN